MKQLEKHVWFKVLPLFMICSLLSFSMMAQTISVRGIVTEALTGDPIIGANVLVKGTTNGTITGLDGDFQLSNVPSNGTLVFSYLGYDSQEVQINGRTSIDVSLEESSIGLQEVVAVGYGSQRKKEITGSVAGLKENDLIKGVQSDPMGMLQGKVAGLNISKPNAGDPNGDYKFQLRGTSSLTGNTSPLIVVDGIPQADISAIPQDDIESIDVLKDGSAAAIYGTRGTNGVILVTTKRGLAGKTSVQYNGYISLSSISRKPDVMNREEFLANGGNDRGSNTDWLDEITRTPISHSHNVAITGGTSAFNYRGSVSYRDSKGIAKKSGFEEVIGRFSANQNLFDSKIQIAYDATYRHVSREGENQNLGDYSAFRYAAYYNPTAPVWNLNGTVNVDRDADGYYQLDMQSYTQPVAYLMQRDRQTTNSTLQGSARITWNIISGLRAQVFGSLKYTDFKRGSYTSRNTYNSSNYGSASRSYGSRNNKTLETTIDWVKTFGEHNIVLLGGYAFENNYREDAGFNNSNFDSDVFKWYNLGAGSNLVNDPTQDMMSGSVSQDNLVSFFGRVNYNYANRYLLSASVRREGSTRLGKDYKWGTFPAISLGWSIKNEAFMQSLTWLDDLKLRIGFGVTGNMPTGNYLSLPMMGVVGKFYDNTSGRWLNAYGPTQNQNNNLKWEKKSEWNLGLDVSTFKGRLNLTLDLYKRKVTDLLYNYRVPTPPYQYSTMLANVGDATSKGLEISISATPVKNKNLSWTSSVNFSFNTNRLDKLSNETFHTDWLESGYLTDGDLGGLNGIALLRMVPGGKVGDFFLPVFKGFDPDGKWIFEDINGDGVYKEADDKKVVGNAQPDFIAGWTNELKYRDFDLSFTFRAVVGNDVFNVGRMALENPGQGGTEKNMLKSVRNTPLNDSAQPSTYYLEDGSFVKLDNVTLGYNMPTKNIKGIQNLRLYLTGQNLLTITGYKGVEPEVDMVGLDNMGIERSRFYPTSRSFIFGVNVTF